MDGPIPEVRAKRPGDCGPPGDPVAESFVRDQKNWDAGERREKAVDAQQYPCGRLRVDTKNFKDSADQIGIERRLPGGGAGIAFVGTAEAAAQCDGSADAAHLPAKFEVGVAGAGSILMKGGDEGQGRRNRREK